VVGELDPNLLNTVIFGKGPEDNLYIISRLSTYWEWSCDRKWCH